MRSTRSSRVAVSSDGNEPASRRFIQKGADVQRPLSRTPKTSEKDQKFTRVFSLLAEVKSADENSCFVQALGAFREAVNRSQELRPLREVTFDTALEEAERLLPQNWRVAEALLGELPQLELDRRVPISLRVDIERAARQECIATVLAAVEVYSDWQESRTRLERALRLYPGEPGLENQLKVVKAALAREPSAASQPGTSSANSSAQAISPNCAETDAGPEYAAAIAAVKALLETGPLSRARQSCREAAQQFPHSPDLWVLSNAIDDKDREVCSLLKTGQDNLQNWNLAGARDAFLQALRLVPLDHELRGYIADKLDAGARAGLESDWRFAETLLGLSHRISPGHFVPPDLTQSLHERKLQDLLGAPGKSSAEPVSPYIDVEILPYAESFAPATERPSPRPSPASLALIDVQPHPVRLILKRVAAYSVLLALISSLFIGVSRWTSLWLGHTQTATRVYQIPPLSSVLADARTQPSNSTLTIRSNVAYPTVANEEEDWDRANRENTLASFGTFIRKYPASWHLQTAYIFMEELQWPYVDRHDFEVLKAFISKYPNGAHSAQASALLQALNQPKSSSLKRQVKPAGY